MEQYKFFKSTYKIKEKRRGTERNATAGVKRTGR